MSDTCGCCEAQAPAVPAELANRPELSAVAYRVGTFASFRAALLQEAAQLPGLAALRSRAADDYTVTLAELWAAVADVIAFYQERIANEAWLGTARHRDSVLRLVRLLDYQLRPGLSSTTLLAFTLEPGARLVLPARLRVQSVPAEGEKPQKYETDASVDADARLNRLRVFSAPEPATPLAPGATEAIVAPGSAALEAVRELAAGDRVVLFGTSARVVVSVGEKTARDDQVVVRWTEPLPSAAPLGGATPPTAWRLGRTFHLFGVGAPASQVVLVNVGTTAAPSWELRPQAVSFALTGDGSNGTTQLFLDARYDGLGPGTRLLVVASTGTAVATDLVRIASAAEGVATRGPVTGTVTKLELVAALQGIPTTDIRTLTVHELLGEPLAFWPHRYPALLAAPEVWLPGRRTGADALEVGRTVEKGALRAGVVLGSGDLMAGRRVLLGDASGGSPVPATVVGDALTGSELRLSPTDDDPDTLGRIGFAPGQAQRLTMLVSAEDRGQLGGGRHELTITLGGLPPQRLSLDPNLGTQAALDRAIRTAVPEAPAFARTRVLQFATALIVIPGIPGDSPRFGPTPDDTATVEVLGLGPGRARWVDGLLSGPLGAFPGGVKGRIAVAVGLAPPQPRAIEDYAGGPLAPGPMAVVGAIARATGQFAFHRGDGHVVALPPIPSGEVRHHLRVAVTPDLPLALAAGSAFLLGNVAPASHGETVRDEVVGDGDASVPFQRFTLAKKPVTQLSAPGAEAGRSTLRLMVNGVAWQEVPSLYGAGPRDEVYVRRVADDGTTTVQGGDGVSGERLPTGRANVVASYRTGLGLAGRVRAGALTTLLDRPAGLKSATNPLAADGGADPESLDHARENAPGTVRTFGRAVSLRDHADVALASGEVRKATAAWVWTGERRVVHLTVAAQGGARFSTDGLRRIRAALDALRDPNLPLQVDNYAPVPIFVAATVQVAADRAVADVLAAARAALRGALSFEALDFGRPVYLSDVYAVLQGVAGVVSADVDDLNFKQAAVRVDRGTDGTRAPPHLRILPARPAGAGGLVLPAEQATLELPEQDLVVRATGGITG